MKPSVSVVIPTYNSASSLPDAIRSVREQQWPRLEIVVVDDGSSDGTEGKIAQHAGADLVYLRRENGGPAIARNIGIEAARGEWIAFLDADDQWLPDKLSRQFETIEKEPRASFCCGDVWVREADGREHYMNCTPSRERLIWELLLGNRLATPTVMIRRDCFFRVGLFDPELRSAEDWDLWLRLATRIPYVRTERALAIVRRSVEAKYSVEQIEQCTFAVLAAFFSDCTVHFPEGTAQEDRVYAWHHSVFARSYLREARVGKALYHALRAVGWHPSGVKHVVRPNRRSVLKQIWRGQES